MIVALVLGVICNRILKVCLLLAFGHVCKELDVKVMCFKFNSSLDSSQEAKPGRQPGINRSEIGWLASTRGHQKKQGKTCCELHSKQQGFHMSSAIHTQMTGATFFPAVEHVLFKVPVAWDTWSNDSRVREIGGPVGHHLSMDRAVIPALSSVMTTSSAVVFVI